MALVTTPNRIHPAFNPIYFEVTEGDQIQISFVSELGEQRVFLSRIAIDGIIGSDVSGVVKHIFREAREALDLGTPEPFAWVDYRLKSDYIVNSEIFTAVNAVRQPGYDLETDLYLPALTEIKPNGNTIRIPKYKGYPTGVSLLYNSGYGEDTSKYLILQVTVTAGQIISLPLYLNLIGSSAMCRIDWGDGQTDQNVDVPEYVSAASIGAKTHTYTTSGTFEISVSISITQGTVALRTTGTSSAVMAFRVALINILQWAPGVQLYQLDYCTSLVGFPALPKYTGSGTEEAPIFSGCTSITEIPENLLSEWNGFYYGTQMFYGCTGITSIPSGIFKNCSNVITLFETFTGCTNLVNIPQGLLQDCINLTNVGSMFRDCSSIVSLPGDLFQNNTKIEIFTRTFMGCSSLTTPPASLFQSCTVARSFDYTFYGCSSLQYVYGTAFMNCTLASTFAYCFSFCTSFTGLVNNSNLFSYNTAVTSFAATFYGCTSMVGLPGGIFWNNTEVTNFASTFERCTNLNISLLNGVEPMFKNCTKVQTFASTFKGCSSLTNIPFRMFYYNNSVTTFNECFSGCSNISSIGNQFGVDIFPGSPISTNIQMAGVFYGCSSLTDIPSSLFNSISVRIRGLQGVFRMCTSLVEIPVDLLKGVTRLVEGSNQTNVLNTMDGMFQGCSSLQSIPEGLFDDCTSLSLMNGAFADCTSLITIPLGLFDNNLNLVSTRCCFYNCSNITSESPGTTQKLWERPNISNYGGTFYNCTKMSDYASIPSTWKTQI